MRCRTTVAILALSTLSMVVVFAFTCLKERVLRDSVESSTADEQLMAQLDDSEWSRREGAMRNLQSRHQHVVSELIAIVDSGATKRWTRAKPLAASLLGDWRAHAAIPALSRNLDFEIGVTAEDFREFYMEAYPCAEAISKMGRSALTPTLEAIAKKEEPLTPTGARVAAYLIVSLCDESKEVAIEAIRKAEERFPESKNLHPIQMQIEHFMDFHKNVERQHAPPSA